MLLKLVWLEGFLQVKKLFKGLKCHCWVNKDYKVILKDIAQIWDDLRLCSYFEDPLQMQAVLGYKVILGGVGDDDVE